MESPFNKPIYGNLRTVHFLARCTLFHYLKNVVEYSSVFSVKTLIRF